MKNPRTLCLVAHHFGAPVDSVAAQAASADVAARPRRQQIVERTVSSLKRLSTQLDIEIVIAGMKGRNILPLDLDYADQIESPWHILWRLFAYAQREFDCYDYLLVLEDDILVPEQTIARMLAASRELADLRHLIFPNRIEFILGVPAIPDLLALRGWTGRRVDWRSQTWHQAANPHSAVLFLGRHQSEEFRKVDFSRPHLTIGEYTTSAFERAHSGYMLFREKRVIPRHYVIHQDSWLRRNSSDISFGKIVRRHLRHY